MTIKELKAYAKEVGVPARAFKETFAPLLADESRVLNDYEATVAKIECDRQAAYWKAVKRFLDRDKGERKEK